MYGYSNFGAGQICSLSNVGGDVATTTNHGSESGSDSEGDDTTASIEDIISDDNDGEDEQEPDITDTGPITGCVVYGVGSIGRQRLRVLNTSTTRLNYDTIEDEDDDPLKCQICKRNFVNHRAKNQHICKGVPGRRDLTYFGLKYAIEHIDQYDSPFRIIQMCNYAEHNLAIFSALTDIQEYRNVLICGWACTPQHGKMYGKKYIGPFKEEILNMFLEGETDIAQRRGPGQMLEALMHKYPGRIDLPSETEIRQTITMLTDKKKKGKTLSFVRKTGIVEPYRTTVMRIFVESQANIKPADAWTKFQLEHTQPTEEDQMLTYPSKKQVTSLISSSKTKYKNKPLPNVEQINNIHR